MAADETLSSGDIIENRYRIEEEIGRGAMGVVYRVHDPVFSCDRALKILREDQIDNEDAVRRFREEGRAAVRASGDLAHPNIVTVYDVGELDGRPYIIMELFRGQPLDVIMAGEASLPSSSVIRIGIQLCEALASAHAHGVVHRDVKPANIMMSADGEIAKLTDFSVARVKSGDDHAATKTGVVIGAPRYMSPEQALAKGVDGRSDLYGLGVVLYELLTGRKAFRSDTITALLIEITQNDPEPIRKIAPHVSPGLEHIVSKLLEKDPSRRFQTGEDAAAALRRELKNLSDRDMREQTGLPPEVRAAGLLAAIVAALMVVGGAMLFNQLTNSARQQTAENAVAVTEVLTRLFFNTSDFFPAQWSLVYGGALPVITETTESVRLIRVIGPDGETIVSSDRDDPATPEDERVVISWGDQVVGEFGRARVDEVELSGGIGKALCVRTSMELRNVDGGIDQAEFLVAVSTAPLREAARLTFGLLALLTLLTVGAVGSLAYLATRRFANPMSRLRDALKDLAIGDADVRLSGGQGVISETFEAFNAVAARQGHSSVEASADLLDALAVPAAAEQTDADQSGEADAAGPATPDEPTTPRSAADDTDRTAIFTPPKPAGSE